ncbi:MAG: spore germination protein, partial [Clostridia bacterium]|nr:spore germination protein [Clostridia bacterium]
IVKEIERKIKKIDIDGIIDSSYVAKLLEDRRYSLFKQTGSTEKPDILASKLLDGRVGIIVDGSPTVLTLPFMLIEDFYDSEDYYRRPVRTSVVRLMRLLGVFFAIFLPGMFVAFQSHQYQILPLKLLITIINSTSGIPFSPITEMLIALILFEVLGEASVRMPRFLGMAMSVVGGIILGETAVNAGVLSSLTVLITALSSIGLYAIPDEVGTFSVIRLIYVFIGASLGTYGILLCTLAISVYVASLESYGVPYLAPLAPIVPQDLKDSILKLSMIDHPIRTSAMGLKNKVRLKNE